MKKHRKINNPNLFNQIKIVLLTIGTTLLVILTNAQSFAVFTFNLTKVPQYQADIKISPISQIPVLPQKAHPLPSTLARSQHDTNSGDYFAEIKPTKYGYLIWSQFPVKVYLETPQGNSSNQAQQWVNTVSKTVEEWNSYLPLTIVKNPEVADINIVRKSPPLQFTPGSKIPRARSALTSYEIYTKENTLYHRFTILLSPTQTGKYLLAAARHELGHALGIWGHSKDQGDALYFSQVSDPPMVSSRDVNTLKKIYQQPTSLGWENNN
ncbi:peptidase [Rivularia sp. UHCC 0363]|uniref:peptidase n=1 Tax=Rivularia sp. UHCC 0363 TaxID=3110244 RepID=UPI002B204122|nr:peptidase [Rivularia sp. UHCC 0363]MEA5594866.1 peptidase [Rivularia sp. UHCC 0363]